jgi:dTDP-4-amino-4,6-dideoxygalactose transaminase
MQIPFVNLKKQSELEKNIIIKSVKKVLKKSSFILGDDNRILEKKIEKYTKAKYCALLNSGTDALTLALHVVGVKRGDEVITCSNSFIASAAAIVHLGAKPIFIDVKDDQNMDPKLIEKKITKKTKAIMPVHLTGRVCDMTPIIRIAKKYNLKIVEDAAQSFGSKYKEKFSGTFGDIGCISLHPLKNFNGVGDGGLILTNSKKYYERIVSLRNHGIKDRNFVDEFGYVSRYDSLKAAILINRFRSLKKIINNRRKNAKLYQKLLNTKKIFIPVETKNEFNTYHTFVIQVENREKLIDYLKRKKISTAIHYPIPIHMQKAYKRINNFKVYLPKTMAQSKRILSLPINDYLSKREIIYISKNINKFYN